MALALVQTEDPQAIDPIDAAIEARVERDQNVRDLRNSVAALEHEIQRLRAENGPHQSGVESLQSKLRENREVAGQYSPSASDHDSAADWIEAKWHRERLDEEHTKLEAQVLEASAVLHPNNAKLAGLMATLEERKSGLAHLEQRLREQLNMTVRSALS